MKRFSFFFLISLFFLPTLAHADSWTWHNKYMRERGLVTLSESTTNNQYARIEEIVFTDDYAQPDSTYVKQHLQLISWYPTQPAKKILNRIKIGQTNQLDILKLLSGPNIIGLDYPSEQEKWVYYWIWAYDLRYPIEDTLVKMDHPGRRLLRGKNPVELEIIFDDKDVVADVRMRLIKRGPEI